MESRLIPFAAAAVICFAAAFFLGAGFWYFFGTSPRSIGRNGNSVVLTSSGGTTESNVNAVDAPAAPAAENPVPAQAPPIKTAPAGEVSVEGGEVVLGGGETKLPVRRVAVEDFAAGETEVTNAQYAEFVEATARRAPSGWRNGKYADGAEDEPVVGVTWADANDYCRWLSEQIGATVRLPSEAEWERAARGDTGYKYPWGDEWSDDAAHSVETKGKIVPVRSLAAGRSPTGAYEMVGNVWEWTGDLAVDEFGKPILYDKTRQRIIKGGSAREPRAFLKIAARAARPENKASELLGFRYIVIRSR